MYLIKMNDLELKVSELIETSYTHPITGKCLTKLLLKGVTEDVTFIHRLIESISEKPFNLSFQRDSDARVLRMKLNSPEDFKQCFDDSTEPSKIHFELEALEWDTEIPENWDFLVGVCEGIIMNRLLIRSLIEMFVEKGIFSRDELNTKTDRIKERDYEALKKYLFYGIPEK